MHPVKHSLSTKHLPVSWWLISDVFLLTTHHEDTIPQKNFRITDTFCGDHHDFSNPKFWYFLLCQTEPLLNEQLSLLWSWTPWRSCDVTAIVYVLNTDPSNMLNSPWRYRYDVHCLMPPVCHHIDTTQTSTVTIRMMCETPFWIATVCTIKRWPTQQTR